MSLPRTSFPHKAPARTKRLTLVLILVPLSLQDHTIRLHGLVLAPHLAQEDDHLVVPHVIVSRVDRGLDLVRMMPRDRGSTGTAGWDEYRPWGRTPAGIRSRRTIYDPRAGSWGKSHDGRLIPWRVSVERGRWWWRSGCYGRRRPGVRVGVVGVRVGSDRSGRSGRQAMMLCEKWVRVRRRPTTWFAFEGCRRTATQGRVDGKRIQRHASRRGGGGGRRTKRKGRQRWKRSSVVDVDVDVPVRTEMSEIVGQRTCGR